MRPVVRPEKTAMPSALEPPLPTMSVPAVPKPSPLVEAVLMERIQV